MKINLVKDEAAQTDAFGGHGWVATTLVGLLRDTEDVRFVGLLGPWGSGKSTVVRLAEDELRASSSKPENVVFTYDAWLHQSDPPRRAFIEAFIAYLVERGISTEDEWQAELDEVQRRVETHTVESTPRLTPWGTGIIMSLLLLPVGVRLTSGHWIAACVGWFLVAFPFLIAVANWWAWRRQPNPLKKSFYKWENFKAHKDSRKGKSVLSAFVNRSVDKTTNRIVKTPEPTSIEFRAAFFKIMDRVSSPDIRFIFVLDNLDRISEDDALTIWSTFRSLFAHSEASSSPKRSFKVVIPLDFSSLHKLYAKDKKPDEEVIDRVQSLLDKSFDAVLRVGPPIASDWHAYLEQKLRYAVDGISDRDVYVARSIYQSGIKSRNRGIIVTPREINAYVNAACILLMQRGQTVSFASICYYACFTNRGNVFDIDDVLAATPKGGAVASRLDPDWRRDVAAIHFGVPSDRALQLLLRERVSAAVGDGLADQFAELEHIRGFDVVLEQLINDDEELKLPRFYANLSALLSDAGVSGAARDAVMNRIQAAAAEFGRWDTLDDLTAIGLAKIAKAAEPKTIAGMLHSLALDDSLESIAPSVWVHNVAAIVTANPGGAPASIRVPLNAAFFVSCVRAAIVAGISEFAQRFTSKATADEVGAALGQWAEEEGFSQDAKAVVETLIQAKGPPSWNELITAAKTTVRGTDRTKALNALSVIMAIRSVVDDEMAELGLEGQLSYWFNLVWQDEDPNELATIFAAILSWWSALPVNSHRENSDGYDILTDLDNITKNEAELLLRVLAKVIETRPALMVRSLVELARAHPNSRRLALKAVRDAFVDETADRIFVKDTVAQVEFLLGEGRQDGRDIVSHASAFDKFWDHAKRDLSPEIFARLVYRVSPERITHIAEDEIGSNCRSYTAEEWSGYLAENDTTIQAVARLGLLGKQVDLGPNFLDGVTDLLRKIVDGSLPTIDYDIEWLGLLDNADQDGVKQLAQEFYERLLSADNISRARVVSQISDDFWKQKTILKSADRFTRTLIIPLAASTDGTHLALLAEGRDQLASLVRKARKPIRREVGQLVRGQAVNGLIEAEVADQLVNAWNAD